LKFTKFLSRQGHQVEVLTPENPAFNLKDQSLLSDIPASVKVHKIPIWEPTMLFGKKRQQEITSNKLGGDKKSIISRLMTWVRGNLLIPDGRVFWKKPASRYAVNLLATESFDAVITTGPPHSMHLIGQVVKEKYNSIKWIADFRDTWSQIDFLQEFGTSEWAMRRHRRLEQKVLSQADIVTTVNDKTGELLNELTERKIEILHNGYDPDDFSLSGNVEKGDRFIISHFGLLNRVRYPEKLLLALEELCEERPDFKEKLVLQLGGVIEDFILERLQKSQHLSAAFEDCGYLSHGEVISRYQKSSLLLLLLNNTPLGKTIMTGKIYEYLAADKPILGLGFTDSEPARLIENTGTGRFFDYENKDDLKNYILSVFEGNLKLIRNISDIEQFSREKNALKLAEMIA
jgi:glycosyltransferase involved in cell wall biosynthesis